MLAPLLASVAEIVGQKSKDMRIWNSFWRGLTPINAFGSVTGHPLPPPSFLLFGEQAARTNKLGRVLESHPDPYHWMHLSSRCGQGGDILREIQAE